MFKVYGTGGKKGLKAEDLERNHQAIISLGMHVPEGIIITTDVFLQIMEEFELTEEDHPKKLGDITHPSLLLQMINNEILDTMQTGLPYALRSSALSERGGTGIYHSSFFIPTGIRDKDLEILWDKEKEVYAGEFTSDAKAWRKKNDAEIGMAILIHAVVGFKMGEYFLPPLSGVAYTSYQGLPTVRVVIGLGTMAVNGKGIIYNLPPNEFLGFQRDLWDQDKADAINTITGNIERISSQYEEIHSMINFASFCDLFKILAELKKYGEFSLEWVITEDGITVVQCNPYEDKLPGDACIDKEKYFLLAHGSDVMHSGKALCNGLVFVSRWSSTTANFLEDLNEKVRNYLLVVPQDALSLLAGIGTDEETGLECKRLSFSHFSNASAVIERQRSYSEEEREKIMMLTGRSVADHSDNRGASHFQQLCARSDILFLGAQFDSDYVFNIPGQMKYVEGISVWEIEAIVLADGVKKEGYAYIAKRATNTQYSPRWVTDCSMALRDAANSLSDRKQMELANHFYNVHYGIGNNDNPMGFNPYEVEEGIMEECGLEGFINSIEAVIKNVRLVRLSPHNMEEFRIYLLELRDTLVKK